MKKENNNKKKEGKKKMKKNKGFTLVELLAVIAILAILVIMALPAVLRMYRQSRINTFQNEVRGVYKSAQQQFVSDSMLLESGQTIAYTNAGTSVTGVDIVKELDMTGNSNFKYLVIIDVDGKVKTVKVTNGTYSYAKTVSDLKVEDIDVENGNEATLDSDITDSILNVSSSGSGATNVATCVIEGCTKTTKETELIIGGEHFYVVSSDDETTILLAKYDLKSDENESYTQDSDESSANVLNKLFGSSYWDNNGLISPYNSNGAHYCSTYPFNGDTNCAYVYDENTNSDIVDAVDNYAIKISNACGASMIGRLMSIEEAYSLSIDVRKDFNGSDYWLGSARGKTKCWAVGDDGEIFFDFLDVPLSIRPVLVVSTSDI